jgi:hypothetical protein
LQLPIADSDPLDLAQYIARGAGQWIAHALLLDVPAHLSKDSSVF